MSQVKKIENHLKELGIVTPAKAEAEYGTTRLARIIGVLRERGMNIRTKMKTGLSGREYAEYQYSGPSNEEGFVFLDGEKTESCFKPGVVPSNGEAELKRVGAL